MLEGLVLLGARVVKLHIEVEKEIQRLGERLCSWKVCHLSGDIEVVYKGVMVHNVGSKMCRDFDSMEVYGVVLESWVVGGYVWGILHIFGFGSHIGEGLAHCSMREVFAMSVAHTQLVLP